MHFGLLTGAIGAGALLVAGLAVNAATQDESGAPQMREVPAPDARFEIWNSARPGVPVQAAVTFSSVVADARVGQLLRQSGVKPYAVHMFLADRYGVHRTDPGQASPDLIAKAREASIAMQEAKGKGIVARAKALQAQGENAEQGLVRALPDAAQTRRNALAGLRGGAPMIYGLEVVGTREHLAALAGAGGVASVEAGIILPSGKIAVPTPDAPAQKGGSPQTMSRTEIGNAIDRLAAGDLEE